MGYRAVWAQDLPFDIASRLTSTIAALCGVRPRARHRLFPQSMDWRLAGTYHLGRMAFAGHRSNPHGLPDAVGRNHGEGRPRHDRRPSCDRGRYASRESLLPLRAGRVEGMDRSRAEKPEDDPSSGLRQVRWRRRDDRIDVEEAVIARNAAPRALGRIGLETGASAIWLWTELKKLGLPVICVDARHAKAGLKMQINKSDRNDAVGIAHIMQCGWYKEGPEVFDELNSARAVVELLQQWDAGRHTERDRTIG
jgi:hypothetical protein